MPSRSVSSSNVAMMLLALKGAAVIGLAIAGPRWIWAAEGQAAGAAKPADPIEQMAKWYKPGHFDGATFYFIGSSHNDIAYLDDPKGTADFRAENLIAPALDLMKIDDSFVLDVETTLYLKEFLQRRPERIGEVKQRIRWVRRHV